MSAHFIKFVIISNTDTIHLAMTMHWLQPSIPWWLFNLTTFQNKIDTTEFVCVRKRFYVCKYRNYFCFLIVICMIVSEYNISNSCVTTEILYSYLYSNFLCKRFSLHNESHHLCTVDLMKEKTKTQK